MLTFTIDGQTVQAEEGQNLLEVALAHGFDIPTLCYHPSVSAYGACRLCLVEVTQRGRSRITTSCNYPALPGISVVTRNDRIDRLRRLVMELILCRDPGNPQLQAMADRLGVDRTRLRFASRQDGCILCGLCERICRESIGADAISFVGRGHERRLATPFDEPSESCVGCLACAMVCPTQVIEFTQDADTRTIWKRTFTLVKCKECGAVLGTPEELALFQRKTGLDASYFDTCDACRKKQTATAFAAVTWGGQRP